MSRHTPQAVPDDQQVDSNNGKRGHLSKPGARAQIEPLERRRLLAAAITVLAPNGARVNDGGTVTLTSTPQASGVLLEAPFTFRNDGDQTLTLGLPSATGDFTFISPPRPTLSPGETTTLLMGVDLTNPGAKTSTVTFSTNDPLRNPFDFVVNETVTSTSPTPTPTPTPTGSGFTVLVNGQTLSSGQSTPVDFGSVVQGQPGPTRTFTVTNQGASIITFGSVAVPAGFVITDPLSAALAPGTSDTLAVRLVSTTPGTKSGNITIPSNVSSQTTFTIPVTGTVTPLAPQITVLQDSTPITSGQTTVNFGSVAQGQPGPSKNFLVTNNGALPLTLGTPTLPSGFTLTDPLVTTLAPGASDVFTVQLDSSSLGPKAGNISIPTNDSAANPFLIPVTGTVVNNAPLIAVTVNGTPVTSGQTTPVNFGTVGQGQPAPTRTFTVTNQGSQQLTLGAPTVPAGFTLIDPLVPTLAPGASDTFSVALADTSTLGTRAGTISIPNNDPTQNPFDIPVTASVVTATPGVTVQVNGQSVTSGQSTPINFGTAALGATGPTQTFTVTNSGTSPLTLGAVTVPAGFTLLQNLPSTTLAPGASGTFQVALDTSTAGTHTGNITFSTNDPAANPFTIPVTGTVSSSSTPTTPAGVTVQVNGTNVADGRTLVSFGTVVRGQPGPTRTFTVTNSTANPLTLSAVSVPAGFTLTAPLASTLAPGASASFTVRLDSTTLGRKAGSVSFTTTPATGTTPTTGATPSTVAIPVAGTVTARPLPTQGLTVRLAGGADLTAGHTTVKFGRVPRSHHGGVLRHFRITNKTHSTLSLAPPQVPAGFTVTNPLAASLAPGASDVLTLRMDTTTPGPKLGRLLITTTSPSDPTLTIPLSGRVRPSTPTPFSHHPIKDPTS